jgi:hypothetical protein
MMTKLKDFWQQLWLKIQKTPWITLQGFLMVVVGLFFLALIIWSGPITKMIFPTTPFSATVNLTTTPVAQPTSSIPLEYHQDMRDTIINILGAVLVLLIIIIGTLTHMTYRRKKAS